MLAMIIAFKGIIAALSQRSRSERGATAIEYAIMVSLVAVVIILAVAFLGAATTQDLECTGQAIKTTTSC